jgi:hypothetical protein
MGEKKFFLRFHVVLEKKARKEGEKMMPDKDVKKRWHADFIKVNFAFFLLKI